VITKNDNTNGVKSGQDYELEISNLKSKIVELEYRKTDKNANIFKLISENSKDMIYRMRLPSGVYEYVSPASKKIFGISPQKFQDNPILIQKAIHPDWVEYFKKQWALLLMGQCPDYYEYQIIHAETKKVRWLNQRNSLVKDEEGNVAAIEGIVTDVTRYKDVEMKLLKSEERYRSLYENSPDMLGSVSVETRDLIFCNQTLLNNTGYSKDEIIGKSIFNLYHDDSLAKVKIAFEEFLKKGYIKDRELTLKRKDGSKLPVRLSVNSIRSADGEILHSTSVWRDISEEIESQKEITRLAKFPEENPNPVLRFSSQGELIYHNPAATELWNMWNDQNQKYFKKETLPRIKESYTTNTMIKYEVEVEDISYSLTFAPIAGKDFVNVYGLDISAQKQARQEIERLAKFPAENPNPVMRISSSGAILYSNLAAEKLLEEWQQDKRKLHDSGLKIVQLAYVENEIKTREIQIIDHTFSLTFAPIAGKDFVNVYGLDITTLKQVEEELNKHKENLEELVLARTKELQEKNKTLEHFNQLFVGREFRIKELREKVKKLEDQLNQDEN